MLYVLYCVDKPDSLELRLANREEHLKYAGDFLGMIKLAGPMFLDDGETMAGSMLIMEADTKAEIEAFSEGDPYRKAGLFQTVDIRPFVQSLGK